MFRNLGGEGRGSQFAFGLLFSSYWKSSHCLDKYLRGKRENDNNKQAQLYYSLMLAVPWYNWTKGTGILWATHSCGFGTGSWTWFLVPSHKSFHFESKPALSALNSCAFYNRVQSVSEVGWSHSGQEREMKLVSGKSQWWNSNFTPQKVSFKHYHFSGSCPISFLVCFGLDVSKSTKNSFSGWMKDLQYQDPKDIICTNFLQMLRRVRGSNARSLKVSYTLPFPITLTFLS